MAKRELGCRYAASHIFDLCRMTQLSADAIRKPSWNRSECAKTDIQLADDAKEQLAETGNLDRTYPSLLERGLRTPTFLVILMLAHQPRTRARAPTNHSGIPGAVRQRASTCAFRRTC